MHSSNKFLGVFSLAMINVAAVVSLRNLPSMAGQGLAALFFYAVAALCFLIPSALVCAELATTWRGAGGVYRWTKIAYGPKVAFITIWLSWMITVSFLPTLTQFIATNLVYMLNPEWAKHSWITIGIVLSILWGGTLVNCFGMRVSSLISSIGVILGTLLPGLLIILLGAQWWASGRLIHIDISWDAFTPDLSFANLSYLVIVILGFEGMEITSFHANDVKNPQKTYPWSIFFATILIILISIAGSLSIAFVVPKDELHLVEAVMQTFSVFMKSFGLDYMIPIIAGCVVIGSLTGLVTWLIAPIKGLFSANEDGFLPSFLQITNRKGIPTGLLAFQAILCSLLSCIMILMPDLQSAYWALSMLASIFALVMFLVVFSGSIKLRYDYPHQERPYQVLGKGNLGIWLVSGLGFITCLAATIISFSPPDIFQGDLLHYVIFLAGSFSLLLAPAVWMIFRKH